MHSARLLLLLCLTLSGLIQKASAQLYNTYDILPVNGKQAFNYNEVPDALVPVYLQAIGSAYRWEQSTTPETGFTVIAGATGATYTFSAPLSQTTYFRRRTTTNIVGLPLPVNIYSNVIKIQVVSVNWENLNYVREHDVLVPGITTWQAVDQLPIGQKLQTTAYFDGLRRSVETVDREIATPNAAQPNLWGDVVKVYSYDALGRNSQQYLPYTTSTESGKFKTNPLTEQPQYYTNLYNETNAYSTASYDNSPLNRVANIKLSGTSWAAGQGNSTIYDFNDAADNVRIFTIGYNAGDFPISSGVYQEGSLYKRKYIDENGKQVIEYSDNSGNLILKKMQIDDNPSAAHVGWICTYNVYDDFDRLRFKIQPEGVKWLENNNWSFAGPDGQQVLYGFCFRYEYDEKERMTVKKAPGADELYMLYDQRDRLVLTQDGNQRAKSPGEWLVNFYDELDRNVITALYNTSKTVSTLQSDIDNAVTTTTVSFPGTIVNTLVVNSRDVNIPTYLATYSIEFVSGFESVVNDQLETSINPNAQSNTTESFTVLSNPISPADITNSSKVTILSYNYYDQYNFSGARPFDNSFSNGLAYGPDPLIDPIQKTERCTGKLTGAKTRVLGSSIFLLSTFYYDEKGRAIQTIADNIKAGSDISTVQYGFDGRLLSKNSKHSASNTPYVAFDVLSKYNYDKVGRVTSIDKKYGSNNFKTISSYSFDDMGRLKTKKLAPGYTGGGKSEMESIDYSYNIHNQITGINKDYALKTPGKYNKWGNFFGLYLGYDNRDGAFASQLLDGHVAGTLWSTQGDDVQRKYEFSYDNVGRLVNAIFNEKQAPGDAWSNAKMDFSVTGNTGKITYDLNGNLLSMLQKGVAPGNQSPLKIDDLQYAYYNFGNRLRQVIDNSNAGTANGKMGDFSDGANGQNDDYVYDENGNLVIDLNKNIKDLGDQVGARGIKYNYLDKPEEIHINGKGVIKIIYSASGEKLQKKYTPYGSTTETITTYIGGYVYKGDDLQYINFEEGRIRIVQPTTLNDGYDMLSIDGNVDLPGGKRGAYDYYIRDYQDNVRMIVTEEIHQGSNTCTMEPQRAVNEETLFGQVDASGNPAANNEVRARFPVSNIPGQSSGGGWQNSGIGSYVSRIGNLAGSKIGPNTLLKVMAGDKVSATTQYYYQSPVVNQSGGTSLITDVLLSLTQAISGSGITDGLTKAAAGNITTQFNGSIPFASIANPDATNPNGNNPKAYLTVLFFDERFNFISEGSISARVAQAGNGAAPLVLANIKAPKNGYAYVYVSNQSDEMLYFDNLQVANNRGQIVEENHYYAFGLRIAAISSHKLPDINEGYVQNEYLYNDKEMIGDAELEWYEYGFRNFDPQIGRFTELDPLTDNFTVLTPYQYAGNEPIANIDLDGLEPVSSIGDFTYNTVSTSRLFLPAFSAGASATSLGLNSALKIAANAAVNTSKLFLKPAQGGKGGKKNDDVISCTKCGLIGVRAGPSFGAGEDYQSESTPADYPNKMRKSFVYTDSWNKDNDRLFEKMYDLFNFYTKNDPLRSTGKKMVDHFKENTGNLFEDDVLNSYVGNHTETKKMANNFGELLKQAVGKSGGKLPSQPIVFPGSPVFDDVFGGLGITVHGTQGVRVYLEKYTYVKSKKRFSATLLFEIYDDFGLSSDDVTNKWYAPNSGDLVAWWLLQHRRHFKAYVVKMKAQYTIDLQIP